MEHFVDCLKEYINTIIQKEMFWMILNLEQILNIYHSIH